jgi:ribulose-5-phosphate 4-epimerase/fuculose-1-phosphate aldolase
MSSSEKDVQQDMLVSNDLYGSDLANHFSKPGSKACEHNVVLMTNHGFTCVGSSIKQAVYRAVYTCVNASVQTKALMIGQAARSQGSARSGLTYLDKDQTRGCQKMNGATMERPWGLWEREVEVCPLYRNDERDCEASKS